MSNPRHSEPTKTQAVHHSVDTRREATAPPQYEPPFPPLELVTKPCVTTAEIAYYTNQAEQTWRVHACHETFPDELRPLRIGGRLNWPTGGLKKLLGVAPLQKGFMTLGFISCIVGVALLMNVLLTVSPDIFSSPHLATNPHHLGSEPAYDLNRQGHSLPILSTAKVKALVGV